MTDLLPTFSRWRCSDDPHRSASWRKSRRQWMARPLDTAKNNAVRLLTQRVAGQSVFQLRHYPDVARAELRNGLHRFAERRRDVGQPLVYVRTHVREVRVVLQSSG